MIKLRKTKYDSCRVIVNNKEFDTTITNTKVIRDLIKKSKAWQWKVNYLENDQQAFDNSVLPNMQSVSFQQKCFYSTIIALSANLINIGCSINDFLELENLLFSNKKLTLIDFAEYAIASNVIKSQIQDAIALRSYR